MSLNGCVVTAKELVGCGHHVNLVRLSLGPFLVHILVDRLVERRVLKNHRHNQEKSPAKFSGASLGNAAAANVDLPGLVRRGVNARKGDQSGFGVKAAHIADLRHELRPE